MKTNAAFQVYGGLVKEEPLSVIDDKTLLSQAGVFEAVAPFFGYYSEVPGSVMPKYLYLVMEHPCKCEQIVRASGNIRNYFGHPFDASGGLVTIADQSYPVIRVRNLEQYSHIELLIGHFKNEGVEFRTRIRKFANQQALIYQTKFFSLQPLGDGMYMDLLQPHHGYFTIPAFVNWPDFKELTREAKFDSSLLFFDAATAFYYDSLCLTEMVRIYREGLTFEKLSAIRQRYLKLMH